MEIQAPTKPARKKLTLKKETLRRLTQPELRIVAGGAYTTTTTATTITRDLTKASVCRTC